MPTTAGPTRRSVLCGLAAALAAPGVLAACSSGGGTSAPAPSPASPAPASPAPVAPTTTTGAASGVPLAQVPVGGGAVVTVGERSVLVVQPTAGTVKAFDAVCPHQGATVAPPEGGVITCPAHFSQFDPATGAVRKGPADTGLTEVPARVVDGVVQVT